ncbi:hypothetical protein SPHINGOAX6_70349 [Sphingomonas sp. AX6]|nr:hypothetical protein SPHINGOAX6_70349 [Sphingomonas sp. AX6]
MRLTWPRWTLLRQLRDGNLSGANMNYAWEHPHEEDRFRSGSRWPDVARSLRQCSSRRKCSRPEPGRHCRQL